MATSKLNDGTIVTDINDDQINGYLFEDGYTIRHIETWKYHDDQSFIHWDAPEISIDNLPY